MLRLKALQGHIDLLPRFKQATEQSNRVKKESEIGIEIEKLRLRLNIVYISIEVTEHCDFVL